MGVVNVQPVIMRKALFCMVCRVLRCMFDRLEAQDELAQLMTDLMCCLYIRDVVSLWCPMSVPVSARSVFSLGVHAFLLFVM